MNALLWFTTGALAVALADPPPARPPLPAPAKPVQNLPGAKPLVPAPSTQEAEKRRQRMKQRDAEMDRILKQKQRKR